VQTVRLRELQDICIATQAELENERTEHRRRQARSESDSWVPEVNEFDGSHDCPSFGIATILRPVISEPRPRPHPSTCFGRIERFAGQCDYGTALKEVDHLLRGPLTSDVRVQGLLLKSDIMRRSDLLYDALAACSEALELCDRLEELHSYMPRIHYQRGVCYYQLRMAKQARDALRKVPSDNSSLYAKASELCGSCEDQLDKNRRSGFESHRTPSEGYMVDLKEASYDASSLLLCLQFTS
jgi:hypothetical protein